MKVKYLFIFGLLLFASPVKADYTYMSLSNVIMTAEYGVVGTIVKLDKNYFWLRTDSVIFGKNDVDTFPILRFRAWPCGTRYDDYKIGQKEIAFFTRSNKVIDIFDYVGIGYGSEFELPISQNNDSVEYQYSYAKFKSFELRASISAIRSFKNLIDSLTKTKKPLPKADSLKFSKQCFVLK